jgi:hypothetical protein
VNGTCVSGFGGRKADERTVGTDAVLPETSCSVQARRHDAGGPAGGADTGAFTRVSSSPYGSERGQAPAFLWSGIPAYFRGTSGILLDLSLAPAVVFLCLDIDDGQAAVAAEGSGDVRISGPLQTAMDYRVGRSPHTLSLVYTEKSRGR